MPMEATPFEHDVVAEATKDTDPDTVEPFAGDVTDTPVANAAGEQIPNRHTISDRHFCMQQFSKSFTSFRPAGTAGETPSGRASGRVKRSLQKWRDDAGFNAAGFKSFKSSQMSELIKEMPETEAKVCPGYQKPCIPTKLKLWVSTLEGS